MASVRYVESVRPSPRSADFWLERVFRTETLPFRFADWHGLRAQVLAAANRIQPDLVWADWIGSLLLLPSGVPAVYGHLDFIHQLQPVRKRLGRGRLRRPDIVTVARLKQIEIDLCRRVNAVASVSRTDTALFAKLGVPAEYLPVVGDPIVRPTAALPDVPRAFLFGRSNTAMNASRHYLRKELWPLLEPRKAPLEWHQVGEIPSSKDDDWLWLEGHFTVHGFLQDLSGTLRPGDLNVIPYRDDTGFRAKFVTSAGHAMVNIGYRETYACAAEFEPGANCLAAESTEHFAELLDSYSRDRALRERLAAASRELYDTKFTLGAQLGTYQRLIEAARAGGGFGGQ
jgi:hypothetical protein